MSKCWYCNNELTTGDSPKHFGICNKCYDGMFKSSDTIIRSFTNKISDLEAKLAEKDAERELDNSFWKQECDSLQKTLAEKDKEIEQVTSKLQASYEKEQNQKAIEQLEKVKEILIQNADEIGEEYKEDYFMISLGNVKNIIDQQIALLKGENK